MEIPLVRHFRHVARGNLGLGGREARNSMVQMSLSHRLQAKINADISLRHSRHTSNTGGNYRENGVSAAVTVAF